MFKYKILTKLDAAPTSVTNVNSNLTQLTQLLLTCICEKTVRDIVCNLIKMGVKHYNEFANDADQSFVAGILERMVVVEKDGTYCLLRTLDDHASQAMLIEFNNHVPLIDVNQVEFTNHLVKDIFVLLQPDVKLYPSRGVTSFTTKITYAVPERAMRADVTRDGDLILRSKSCYYTIINKNLVCITVN